MIVHASAPHKDRSGGREASIIQGMVFKILKSVEDKGFTSIAIPPLSTGIAGVDNQTVATSFYNGFAWYMNEKKSSWISDIFVIIYDHATYEDFTNVLSTKHFGHKRVAAARQRDSSSDSDDRWKRPRRKRRDDSSSSSDDERDWKWH